jgi:putative spermidine/putrescine transport system substrate-binding protein
VGLRDACAIAARCDYWCEGKPAGVEIKDPFGHVMGKPGAVRDSGAFTVRAGNFACWNAAMAEDKYLIKRWNDFAAA